MARDLIPPPSPAGRPDPEGTQTHRFVELPPESPAEQHDTPPPKVEKRALPPTQYRNRFGFLAGALGGVVLGSIAIVVAIFAFGHAGGDDDYGLHPNWSAWEPDDHSLAEGAQQIADKVKVQYTHPNGDVLVNVKAVPFPSGAAPYEMSAVATSAMTEMTGPGVLYVLDGMGPGGAITVGKRSENRGMVLQREALELALYTFRYLPEAEMVMVRTPPPPPEEPKAMPTPGAGKAAATATPTPTATPSATPPTNQVVFFRPGDLRAELEVPLGATLAAQAPNEKTLTEADKATIDGLTRSNRFLAEAQVIDPMTGMVRFILHPPKRS
ncbi:hypothetical protein DVA67_010585 [Solirubrobacter sp. CPCC 204708]|uniref:Uncharacterized protein n=1 Tax=Solirubrobacter deserti TaxID=2282478 RepID=A0ABT4RSQ7_9ACTN|nr:hypothetical protein [Solirubrobacter deserti]MBE2316424.1 hypothetical protein [Solirubrobacter deserti]MDA0141627.1 hypothetical protein [Solirubrobacter deserti]